MGFPAGVTLVQVTGQNLRDLAGNPAVSGTVHFKASGQLSDPTHGLIIVNVELMATITNGVMTPIQLPVNDSTVNPNGFTIAVRQEVYYLLSDGVTVSKTPVLDIYNISLGSNLLPTVDLASLAPVGTFTPISGVTVTGTGTVGQVLTNTGNQTASWQNPQSGINLPVGDLGGTNTAPTVTGTHLAAPLPVNQGGTGAGSTAAALTALTGAQTAGKYVRSDGTNSALGNIQVGDVPTLNQNTTGTASNVTGTVAVGNGGTGQTGAAAAFNALSPVSTLGDLIYGSAAFTNSRLSGNTTAQKLFLTQTGTGSVSAAPVWAAIASGDLPVASVSVFGTVQFDGNANHYQPDFLPGAGSNNLVADSGHVHPLPPYVFVPEAYGALGNGKISNTGVTNATTTITIGEAVLSSSDIGKLVMVKNAYNANNASGITTAVGIISSVPSSTSFVASWSTGTPTTSSTGLQVQWATDDTSAIQSMINAMNTFAQNGSGYAEGFFRPQNGKYYGVGGALQSTNGGNTLYNSQLTIPLNAETNPGVTLVFRGLGGGQTRYWNQDFPIWNGGIQSFGLFTTLSAQSTSITNGGNPSVIGGPTGKFNYGVLQGANTTPTYTNTKVVFQDFTILTTHCNSGWTYGAGNFFGCARFAARNFTYGTNGTVQFYKYTPNLGDFTNVTLLSGGLSAGLILPSNGNNADNYLQSVVCNGGYTYGLLATEHTVGNGVTVLYCWSGICPVGNYGDSAASGTISALHAMYFDQACVEACTYHVNIFGTGQSGVGPIIFLSLDTEGTVQMRDNPNTGAGLAAARGRVFLKGSASAITIATGTGTGGLGTGLQIIKEQNLPGVWGAPPALVDGTLVFNTFWRPMTVYLSGGTSVTAVAVSNLASNLTTVGSTNVVSQTAAPLPANTPIRLGPGYGIKVTTSAGTLPTAVWVAD